MSTHSFLVFLTLLTTRLVCDLYISLYDFYEKPFQTCGKNYLYGKGSCNITDTQTNGRTDDTNSIISLLRGR